MDASGGVPEPLLPPQIALQNPDLVGGELFHVLPGLGQILVMLDSDGDENYVPHLIPIDGGFPEPLADEVFAFGRSHLVEVDDDAEIAFFAVESREESVMTAVRVDLASGTTEIVVAEPLRRLRRRVDAGPLTRRARSTATRWATSSSTRSTERGSHDALRDADRGARSGVAAPAQRVPRRARHARRRAACC